MFVQKYEARLAKDISTLQAEYDMLGPGERNHANESREHIAAELDLLKATADLIETFNQRQTREAIDRMEGLSISGEQLKERWPEMKINPNNLKPEDFGRPIIEPPLHPVKIEPRSETRRKGRR